MSFTCGGEVCGWVVGGVVVVVVVGGGVVVEVVVVVVVEVVVVVVGWWVVVVVVVGGGGGGWWWWVGGEGGCLVWAHRAQRSNQPGSQPSPAQPSPTPAQQHHPSPAPPQPITTSPAQHHPSPAAAGAHLDQVPDLHLLPGDVPVWGWWGRVQCLMDVAGRARRRHQRQAAPGQAARLSLSSRSTMTRWLLTCVSFTCRHKSS